MIEPTAALDSLVEERMRPMADQLRGIVADILGCSPDDDEVRLCGFSVVSQCVFYHHCRPVVSRLFPEQRLDAAAIERLADHITRFSLAAMKHLPDPEPSMSEPSGLAPWSSEAGVRQKPADLAPRGKRRRR